MLVYVARSAFFEGGGSLSENISQGRKGASPTNRCWCQKTRVIALSCGIKTSAVHHLVLSQYTHSTHIHTDGRTDRIATAIPCAALHAVARQKTNSSHWPFMRSLRWQLCWQTIYLNAVKADLKATSAADLADVVNYILNKAQMSGVRRHQQLLVTL